MKVFVINDSSPELLGLQIESFRKYMQEDFEFIVLNGGEKIGTQPLKAQEVSRIAKAAGVRVIEITRDPAIENAHYKINDRKNPENTLFTAAGRYTSGVGGHACNYMLQWSWVNVLSKETGPICFVHSDVFLMEPIKPSEYLVDHDICSIINYEPKLFSLWEAFLLVNMPKLPQPETMLWWPSNVEGQWCDTGGPTHNYLKAHPEVRVQPMDREGITDDPALDFHPSRYQKLGIGGKWVFHYQSGSKWCTDMKQYWNFTKEKSDEYHAKKLAWTRKFIGL